MDDVCLIGPYTLLEERGNMNRSSNSDRWEV